MFDYIISSGVKVIFQIPFLHLNSANLGLRRLALGANISDSAGFQISRMNKKSLFGCGVGCGEGDIKKKKVLFENEKMPCVCPEGVEYFCDRKQCGARVNGAINSAVEKLCESWKMKKRQMGNLTQ